jgi:hypothetical protein
MIGAMASIARLTAEPMAPDELSTWTNAGESFTRNVTAPSAARTGSLRATFLISAIASLIRWIGASDRQPKAWRRKRPANCHLWGVDMKQRILAK